MKTEFLNPCIVGKLLVVRYESPWGYHRHRCPNCGYMWEHSDENRAQILPHTCIHCGEVRLRQYYYLDHYKNTAVP